MRIDEAGSDDLALRIDRVCRVESGSSVIADVRDFVADEDDVDDLRVRFRTGVDKAAANQHIRGPARVCGVRRATGEEGNQ
jgi:hypothetical protein